MKCRHCEADVSLVLVDLGSAPPSNAYLTEKLLRSPEPWYPLRVLVCEACWLLQTEYFAQVEELFTPKYAYFSGYSKTWLAHCERYASTMVDRFGLDEASCVVEIAANDGSLLRYFAALGIPCAGVEPTASTAAAARLLGIPIIEEFFSVELAERMLGQGLAADLMAANNVLGHVPDINDFVAGFARLLKPGGVATFELPYAMNLVDRVQFDTIYHEHFSYLSFSAQVDIFSKNGLGVFDAEELPTHGGSLRVFAQRADTAPRSVSDRVTELVEREEVLGVKTAAYYSSFQARTNEIKNEALRFLLGAASNGETVVAYGAAAKGNTLLNYAGVRPDLLPFVVDLNPAKQGSYLPGSRIPILGEQALRDAKPDYVWILPWNIRNEISQQLSYIRDWGGRFVTAMPRLEIT